MTPQSNRHSLSFLTLSLLGVFFQISVRMFSSVRKFCFPPPQRFLIFKQFVPFFSSVHIHSLFGETFRNLRKPKLRYKNLDMKTQYQDASNFNQMRPSFIFNQSLLKWFKKDSYNPRCITSSVSLHSKFKYLFKILEYPEL